MIYCAILKVQLAFGLNNKVIWNSIWLSNWISKK